MINELENKVVEKVEASFDTPPLAGYRLAKLEIYNWGTFDGVVYTVRPQGQTTLLVGENGSGKSTLVDALLTLLVRPQTRNYNVAAGATKNERDEKTYIRGAYDRTVGEAGNPQVQYLRSGTGHYTCLLAEFVNQLNQSSFTICQVLYLNGDGSVEKVYAYADDTRSIVEDIGSLQSTSGVAKHLRDRGFQTTNSYKQYFNWIKRKTHFRDKAMDVFNQTVAVKDVQRLDLFIRNHMLEAKPWKEKVDQLLTHFSELSEAHRMLVRVRQQDELLRPIVEAGDEYQRKSADQETATQQLAASTLYFALQTRSLLEPMRDAWASRIKFLDAESARLDTLQETRQGEIARIDIEIENAGGDRLRELPHLIKHAESLASVKKDVRAKFESRLTAGRIEIVITSPDQFLKARKKIVERKEELERQTRDEREAARRIDYEMGVLSRQIQDDELELAALQQRKNNLPESLVSLRNAMCTALRIAPSDVPFAAELMTVKPEEREWEASIELVLNGFAKSLLVPDDYYEKVSGYVDRVRIQDARGHGQRLVYLRVGRRKSSSQAMHPSRESLLPKLDFRKDHALAGWVQDEIAQRFDYAACRSVEEFQMQRGPAMTINRHSKSTETRHQKDDRWGESDRRSFVLGWDNRVKREALRESLAQAMDALKQLRDRSVQSDTRLQEFSANIEALKWCAEIESFDQIDYETHEFAASQMRLEKQMLEESSDSIRDLKRLRERLKAELDGYKVDRDDAIKEQTRLQRELDDGTRMLRNAETSIERFKQDGSYETMETHFPEIQKLAKHEVTLENIATLPSETMDKIRARIEKLKESLKPLERELLAAMTRFFKKFPDEKLELGVSVDALPSFRELHARISKDDLPKHEARFKQRLNEKVLHEVGLLHGSLENEHEEIKDKIEQLNSALRLLQWKPGTFMRLEPSDCRDKEIADFRKELATCLSGTLDGTAEANEATFVRIEKLVEKFRDDNNERWRQKVIDVRNWFNFAAREIVKETGEARSYYDGGTGQSGGEKGKLAFLVLVAAIAYQYDLDPNANNSDRFHFVMIDEMFSRSDDQHAEYALDLFERFGLQLLIVAPLDAKARVTEPYVGTYLHVIKNKQTHRSELLSITAEALNDLPP